MRALAFDLETCANSALIELALEAAADRATGRGEDPKAVDPAEVRMEMALNPLWGSVIAVGVLGLDDPAPAIRIALELERDPASEAELLRWLWQQILKSDVVISFNGCHFDCRWLLIRSLLHGVAIPPLPRTFWWGWKPGDRLMRPIHVDLYVLLRHRSRHLRLNLSTVCRLLGIDPPQGSGEDIPKLWEEGDYDAIREHLASDLRATLAVWRRLGFPGRQPRATPRDLPF
jgi:hypothetical protein